MYKSIVISAFCAWSHLASADVCVSHSFLGKECGKGQVEYVTSIGQTVMNGTEVTGKASITGPATLTSVHINKLSVVGPSQVVESHVDHMSITGPVAMKKSSVDTAHLVGNADISDSTLTSLSIVGPLDMVSSKAQKVTVVNPLTRITDSEIGVLVNQSKKHDDQIMGSDYTPVVCISDQSRVSKVEFSHIKGVVFASAKLAHKPEIINGQWRQGPCESIKGSDS